MHENQDCDFFDPTDSLENQGLLTAQRNSVKGETQYDDIRPQPGNLHDEPQKPKRNNCIPILGAIMGITSGLCFSICSFIVKYLKHMDPFELSTIRFVGVFLPAAVIVLWVNENPLGPEGRRCYLLLRGIIGAVNLMLQFYAFQKMPIGDASVIIFSAPVFVVIFARIFLKEKCGIFYVIMILITVSGVMLITKPPFLFGSDGSEQGYSKEMMYGVIAAVSSTIFNANMFILLRCLKDVHYSVVMFTFGIVAIFMSGSTTLLFGKVSELRSISDNSLFIVSLLVLSFGGQILLTKASQLEQAGPISIYRTSDIVFAFVWQIIFFQEIPNIFSICGALLVTVSVILTGLNKWLASRKN